MFQISVKHVLAFSVYTEEKQGRIGEMFHHIILHSKSASKRAHIHITHPINHTTLSSNNFKLQIP